MAVDFILWLNTDIQNWLCKNIYDVNDTKQEVWTCFI